MKWSNLPFLSFFAVRIDSELLITFQMDFRFYMEHIRVRCKRVRSNIYLFVLFFTLSSNQLFTGKIWSCAHGHLNIFANGRSVAMYEIYNAQKITYSKSLADIPDMVFSSPFWFHINASVVKCPSAAIRICSRVHVMFSFSRFTSNQLSSYQPVSA